MLYEVMFRHHFGTSSLTCQKYFTMHSSGSQRKRKRTIQIYNYDEVRPVSQKLQVRSFSKLIQNFVGTMGAFHGNFLLPVGSKEDIS